MSNNHLGIRYDFLIKDIIHRELARGGQIFVVYNRVKGILSLAERIRKIVPDAKVVIAHGQMREHALEDVMMNFVSVLLIRSKHPRLPLVL